MIRRPPRSTLFPTRRSSDLKVSLVITGVKSGAPVPPATVVVAPPLTTPPPSSPHARALLVKDRTVIARIGTVRFIDVLPSWVVEAFRRSRERRRFRREGDRKSVV